jgi:hypothetical protein
MGTEVLSVVAVIVSLVDVFFPPEFFTLIAYGAFACIVSTFLSDLIFSQIAEGCIRWLAAFHYCAWQKLIPKAVRLSVSFPTSEPIVYIRSGKEAASYHMANHFM